METTGPGIKKDHQRNEMPSFDCEVVLESEVNFTSSLSYPQRKCFVLPSE